MDRKRTKGRQKVPIERIAKQSDCFATFSKRRLGLFKKSGELCTLCDVDIGVLLFSPTGKPFSFFHPTMESVINQFPNQNRQHDDLSNICETYTRGRIAHVSEMLDKLGDQLEVEKKRENHLAQISNDMSRGECECNGSIEEFTLEQVQKLTISLKNLKVRVTNHEKEFKVHTSDATMGASDFHTDDVLALFNSYAIGNEIGEGNCELQLSDDLF